MLNIWIVQIGEPLIITGNERKMRSNLLAEELAGRGHNVTLWVSGFEHNEKKWAVRDASELLERDRIRVIVLEGTGYGKNISFRRYLDHRVISWKFKRLSKKEVRPDIIVASLPPHDLAGRAVKYAKRTLTPVIVDIRDPWPDVFVDSLPEKLKGIGKVLLFFDFKITGVAMKHADCLVSVSKAFLEWGLARAERNRCSCDRVFYLGYHNQHQQAVTPSVGSRLEEVLEAVGDRPVVTYIGAFSRFHDPSILIDCAKGLEAHNLAFILAGHGDLFDRVSERARLCSNVYMPGWLNGGEIDELLSRSAIGVCPTPYRVDLFPNKAFMYLSAGLPLVSSFQGDLRSIIESEHIGFYYEPGDIEGLTEAIDTLCNDPRAYEGISRNAGRIFEEEFDDENIYRSYAGLVEQVASERSKMETRYSEVTESPGHMATREQLERLYQRYRFASTYADGGAILEVGCGSGLGLGYLEKHSSRVVGGDVDSDNVAVAARSCANRENIAVLELDAHELPFENGSFDLVLLFEAIYYLERPDRFVQEARRVLGEEGHLIICAVNKGWRDYHPSKYSREYFTVPELGSLLAHEFSHVDFFGAFEVADTSLIQRCRSSIKRTASRLNLIPGSLKARELLKRVFIGRLEPIPPQVNDGMADYLEPVHIAGNVSTERFKIIYAVASNHGDEKE